MSRNSEKAQSALNRYQHEANKEAGVLESNPNLRPKFVQKVKSLPQAEKWRTVVLREISVRLTKVQDMSRNEGEIRQINDELNKLFKEKRAWEHHIKNLGGPDYLGGPSMESSGELDIFSNIKGYRYYGRAKELSDVKQLLEAKRRKMNKQPETDIYVEKAKHLSPDYYNKVETNEIENQVKQALGKDIHLDNTSQQLLQTMNTDGLGDESGDEEDLIDFELVPSNEEISQWVINKRKQQLLDKLK